MNQLTNAMPIELVASFNFDASRIRAIQINDEPWFIALDVAALLEYRDAPSMTRMLDDDEKGTHNLRTLGGDQQVTIINESGLFSAILSSRKPEAKRVKKWVTSDVLPSIRKTGQYRTQPTSELSRLEILQMAIEAEKANIQLTSQLAIAAPKVNYYDKVVTRENLLNASQVAQKIKMSAVKLNKYLEELGVYNSSVKSSRVFKQWFVDKGFGLVRQTELGYPQAMFTLKGEAWVIERLVSEGAA